MDEIRVGDLVSWNKHQYDKFDGARGGTGTVAYRDNRKVTIDATNMVRQEVVRFTFRLDEIALKRVG